MRASIRFFKMLWCTVLCGILTGFISLQWHTKPAGLLCFMMQFEAKVSMKGRKYFDFLTISWVIVRYFFFLQFEFLVKSSDGFHILAMTHKTRGSSLFYDADWSQSLYEKYFHPLTISRVIVRSLFFLRLRCRKKISWNCDFNWFKSIVLGLNCVSFWLNL